MPATVPDRIPVKIADPQIDCGHSSIPNARALVGLLAARAGAARNNRQTRATGVRNRFIVVLLRARSGRGGTRELDATLYIGRAAEATKCCGGRDWARLSAFLNELEGL